MFTINILPIGLWLPLRANSVQPGFIISAAVVRCPKMGGAAQCLFQLQPNHYLSKHQTHSFDFQSLVQTVLGTISCVFTIVVPVCLVPSHKVTGFMAVMFLANTRVLFSQTHGAQSLSTTEKLS